MGDRPKTSPAGSLASSFSEKLKVAEAKTFSGDHKEINVAILKATTNQFHVIPKEKHVRTLKLAVHSSRPRREIQHIVGELHRRLVESTDWLTALKTLTTLHRLIRETEPAFADELLRYNEALAHAGRGGAGGVQAAPARLFATENFVDRTRGEGRFDFSEWVRAYGQYLDAQLSVWGAIRWYVEQEQPGAESRMRKLPPRDLLFQLPHLQRLQRRLLDCVPRGAAMHDPVVLFSLSLVVKESFKLYKAVSEGIINLADAFFEMEAHDAARGLEYYKEGIAASEALCGYYATIEQLEEIKRTMQLPKLSAPPADFLRSMEAYLQEAPRPLPADGEAPAPAKKGAPLRKGRLLSSKSSGSAVSGQASVATSRDPGMVLPVPAPSSTPAGQSGGQEVTSPARTSSAVSSAAAAAAKPDLLGEEAGSPAASATAAAAAQKPPPSALDLLSGLDFSFETPADPLPAATANPFADPHAAPPPPPQPSRTANPFGDPAPSPAPGGPQAAVQQPAWGLASPAQAPPAYQQQSYGAPLASPAHAGPAVISDDPFAGFGVPSPAAPRPGAYWAQAPAPPQAQYGAVLRPAGAGDELSKAALNDPFAALTGLPTKGSPAAAGSKLSPPRMGLY